MSAPSTRRPRLAVTFFFEHSLERIPAVESSVPCTFRELTRADLAAMTEVRTVSAEKRTQFEKRMSDGDRCFGAWVDDRLVHYIWVQTRGIHPLQNAGRTAPCPPGAFWLYDARTAADARGKRIYPFVMTEVLRSMRAQGFARCLVYTAKRNVASQRGMKRVGFEPTCRLYALAWTGRVVPLPCPWKRRSMVEVRPDGTVR